MHDWPGWAVDRRWSVHVVCDRVVNRRDLPQGTVARHNVFVAEMGKGLTLAEALAKAEVEAEEHQAQRRPKPHTVTGASVRWQCRCRHDKVVIDGWDQEGMADALIEHLMSYAHKNAVSEKRALERFMDKLGVFEEE